MPPKGLSGGDRACLAGDVRLEIGIGPATSCRWPTRAPPTAPSARLHDTVPAAGGGGASGIAVGGASGVTVGEAAGDAAREAGFAPLPRA